MSDYFGKDTTGLARKKLFLFDMDGTIYMGNNLFDGVTELLKKIKEKGGRYVFITNNSSKSVKDYVKKVRRMGIEADVENFFTSAQAAAVIFRESFPAARLLPGNEVVHKRIKEERYASNAEIYRQIGGGTRRFRPRNYG